MADVQIEGGTALQKVAEEKQRKMEGNGEMRFLVANMKIRLAKY